MGTGNNVIESKKTKKMKKSKKMNKEKENVNESAGFSFSFGTPSNGGSNDEVEITLRKVMKCDDGSNWTKVCKAAMIRIKEKGGKMMVEIEQQKEPKTRHFEHVVPAKTTSHFGQDDNKLW